MPLPVPVERWLRSIYTNTPFDQEWLDECSDYLQTTLPESATPAEWNRMLAHQLIHSDLTASLSSAALPSEAALASADRIATARGGILVQIVAMHDIAHPALTQLDILKQRRAERKAAERGVAPLRVIGGTEQPSEENAEVDQDPTPVFPRGMLKLTLSDGYNTAQAIEMNRIDALSMMATPLGAKLVLKNASVRNGMLLLDPTNCICKGGAIGLSDGELEDRLEAVLNARLRQDAPAQEVPRPRAKRETPAASSRAPASNAHAVGAKAHSRATEASHHVDLNDIDFDDEDLPDEDEPARKVQVLSSSSPPPERKSTIKRSNGKTTSAYFELSD
ncbi:uncharacterized protein L969DRAFT_15207 [Mixia osmundae IAM 14324]|uniref:RecQ-mediated genome instability protein 1 n=1 Tax=Mixia osmundae (strain CBS 9802 / IAM 14324 / JCM 22182 / KY 12970) TaxID=764103 RepID=G7DXL5_MIXOS|nr:uncharacterized protein L969DRAFT_15207 [Mixia osmundae IAM 14324]KEI41181.1 hypothetical protein L969DRAFT_15207 [Mixia osmundae IAM 14324]GAA95325.1 hypothetical protein E5Q_01982 [Mixia osmundae IAM 14324]